MAGKVPPSHSYGRAKHHLRIATDGQSNNEADRREEAGEGVAKPRKKFLMHDITIKPIQVKDHYAIVEQMMRGLHDSEHELFNKAEQWDNIRESYMRHVISTQEENKAAFLIAYIDDKPAGFIFGYPEEPDDSRIEAYTGPELYVSEGYIDPAYRKQGIYRKLNQALEAIYIAKGIRRITRFTLTSNTRMQKFLESEGYRVTRLLYEKWLEPDGKTAEKLELKPPKE